MQFSKCFRMLVRAISLAFPCVVVAQEDQGETVHPLEEVHVTGVLRERSADELAQSITVVREQALERVRRSTLGETLAEQLGVSASSFSAGASRPIIRGLAGARVRTMEDGLDTMDVSTVSVDHAVSVDPLVAEQIEIFRGPASLLYGTAAVGGVINVITNRIPEFAPDDGFEGTFEIKGDSVADSRSGLIALDGGNENFAWHFDAVSRRSEDYEIPGPADLAAGEDEHDDHDHEHEDDHEDDGELTVRQILENSSLDGEAYSVGGSWLGGNSFIGVSVSGFDTNYGIPGHHHHHAEVMAGDEHDHDHDDEDDHDHDEDEDEDDHDEDEHDEDDDDHDHDEDEDDDDHDHDEDDDHDHDEDEDDDHDHDEDEDDDHDHDEDDDHDHDEDEDDDHDEDEDDDHDHDEDEDDDHDEDEDDDHDHDEDEDDDHDHDEDEDDDHDEDEDDDHDHDEDEDDDHDHDEDEDDDHDHDEDEDDDHDHDEDEDDDHDHDEDEDDDDHDHDEDEHAHGAEEEAVRIKLKQMRFDVKAGWFDLSGPIEAINIRFGFTDYEHLELEGDQVGTRFDNEAWEGRFEFMHAPWGEWDGAYGVQLNERQFSAVGAEAFVPPVDTSSYGAFIIEQRDFDNWHVSLGGRVDYQKQEPSQGLPEVSDTATNLSVAGIRDFGDGYSFVLNAALADRLPVAEELYADGPHLATQTVEIGNPDIGVETSRHLDIGIRRTQGDMNWSVTAFQTDYTDFIYLENSGEFDGELPIFNFSQRDADFTGIEAEFFTPIFVRGDSEVDLRLFADYVNGELSTGDYLPRMPPLRYGSRIQFHNDSLLAGLEVTVYDDQEDIAAIETRTEGYTMINADITWTVETPGGTTFEVFLHGRNLADEDVRRHTSFVKDTVPLPGRNVALGFRSHF